MNVAVLLLPNELRFSRSNRRRLLPRQFRKYLHNNEIHRLGCGVQTHILQLSWNSIRSMRQHRRLLDGAPIFYSPLEEPELC